nr:MAG TPA: hypothetical protein [Caudoviricetes sp.]
MLKPLSTTWSIGSVIHYLLYKSLPYIRSLTNCFILL